MKKLLVVVLLLIASHAVLFVLSWQAPGIDPVFVDSAVVRERESYKIVSNSDDPLIRELFTRKIRRGTSIQSVISRFTPATIETCGAYSIYHFSDSVFEGRTLWTYKDRIISAHVGSCTWHWTFFDDMPTKTMASIRRVGELRNFLKLRPQLEEELAPLIQKELEALK